MCNSIKLFKRYHELPDVIINRDKSDIDRAIYLMFIRMLRNNCKCGKEERFREEQFN
jgi:hypothetical protein